MPSNIEKPRSGTSQHHFAEPDRRATENAAAAPDRERLRHLLAQYWDEDAYTYDNSPEHTMRTRAQRAAWAAVLARHLPSPPARILDVGAGTGFLSLPLARLGYQVAALDLSPGMLRQLASRAREERLDIQLIVGEAESPPPGPFEAVVERLLLWTLVNPQHALEAWRRVSPGSRLLSFGGVWGRDADLVEAVRARARGFIQRLQRAAPGHHAPYPPEFTALQLRSMANPENKIEVVEAAGWANVRLERLRDVEWAHALALPFSARLLGVKPEFMLVADDVAAPEAQKDLSQPLAAARGRGQARISDLDLAGR